MKKVMTILMSALLIIGATGCGNPAGVGINNRVNDTTGSRILDLRIKKNGIEYGARSITENYGNGIWGSDCLSSTHCTVENVSGGLRFTITRPSEDCFNPNNGGGWGYVAIYREEIINGVECQTTGAAVTTNDNETTLTCFYPLCEPGERYVFKVQIEPEDVNTYRAYQRYEWLSIVAQDGIGDIDYSNLNANRYCELSYNGENPVVRLSNCIPPNAREVGTQVDYFAGNGDWETPHATEHMTCDWWPDVEFEIERKPSALPENVSFNQALAAKGKNQFFAQYFFHFNVPEATGFSSWKTGTIDSEIVSID